MSETLAFSLHAGGASSFRLIRGDGGDSVARRRGLGRSGASAGLYKSADRTRRRPEIGGVPCRGDHGWPKCDLADRRLLASLRDVSLRGGLGGVLSGGFAGRASLHHRLMAWVPPAPGRDGGFGWREVG